MKFFRFFSFMLAALLLAGCGTVNQQDRAILQAHAVSPDIYGKMLDGEALSLSDVIELSRRGVPPGLITNYMYKVDTVYVLHKADVAHLRSAGVSEPVIAYMLSTTPQYGPGGPPPPYPGPYAYPAPYYPYGYYGGPVIYVGGGYGYGRGWGGGWHHGYYR